MNVINGANNRKIDGFKNKVFLDRNASSVAYHHTIKDRVVYQKVPKSKGITKVVEGRSNKEALICNISVDSGKHCQDANVAPKKADHESTEVQKVSVKESEVNADFKPLVMTLGERDKGRLNSCLIGQINFMYDVDFVQHMLQSEGFKVSISCCSGYYAIIKFEEEEQLDIFWDLKETVLKPWFPEIDRVESFKEAKKLRVWVCIERLPLKAWNETDLFNIGSR
ncbi:hypothetical protein V6N13_073978 [Hibiscus sabdariffa]